MPQPIEAIGGIDTHTDVHRAAVIDTIGRQLATEGIDRPRHLARAGWPTKQP
jgi:hypothetical protein